MLHTRSTEAWAEAAAARVAPILDGPGDVPPQEKYAAQRAIIFAQRASARGREGS